MPAGRLLVEVAWPIVVESLAKTARDPPTLYDWAPWIFALTRILLLVDDVVIVTESQVTSTNDVLVVVNVSVFVVDKH